MTDPSLELARHPFLADMRPEHRARLEPLAKLMDYPAGTVLFDEGDQRHEFFLLITGRVALEVLTHAQQLRVDTLEPGAALGWSSVLLNRGKHFRARALQPVTALVFPGLDVLAACRADTDFGFEMTYRLLSVVSRRLQAARVQVLETYWPTAKKAGA